MNKKIQKYLTNSLKEQKSGIIKFFFIKEVISPLVNRSDDSEDVIVFKLPEDDRTLVAINSRKLKSKDKLFGLQLTRQYGGTLEDSKYNEMPIKENIANINSLLFGDTAVGDNAAGLKARCYYDWAYSIQDYVKITQTMQHNSLTESGTIMATQDVGTQKKGALRKNALFTTKYVMPGAFFPHTVTLTDCTEDMFQHALFTMLQPKAIGGQTTVQGSINMKYHLVGIVSAQYEQPINSLTIAQNFKDKEEINLDSLKNKIISNVQNIYNEEQIIIEDEMKQLITSVEEFYKQDDEKLAEFYKKTKLDSEEYFHEVGYFSKKK